jgi:hypothetical protein
MSSSSVVAKTMEDVYEQKARKKKPSLEGETTMSLKEGSTTFPLFSFLNVSTTKILSPP